MISTMMTNLESLLLTLHPASFTGAIVYAFIFIALAVFATRALRLFVRLTLQRDIKNRIDRTGIVFLRQLGEGAIWVLAFVFYAHLIPSLRSLGTALLTGVSVVSVVLGLAAQNTLGNLIAGISLLIYRPFHVGDIIQVTVGSTVEVGEVETVTLGYAVIQTSPTRRILVPNSSVISQTVINFANTDPRQTVEIPFSISYKSNLEQVKALAQGLAGQHPDTEKVLGCNVETLSPSSVDLSLQVQCKTLASADKLKHDLLEGIKVGLEQAGMEAPYSHLLVATEKASA
jgi:small conductance mechanosensitive channel